MQPLKISVVIPTHNRRDRVRALVSCLIEQKVNARDYEIIVVDDGSTPALTLDDASGGPACRIIRLEGLERSVARNTGAAAARGQILVFLDDDMVVGPEFLTAHLEAHRRWPGALAVGFIRLTDDARKTPFGRFRRLLDDAVIPTLDGVVKSKNFCAAGNMSIPKNVFTSLGGFEPSMVSSEDQDFALRHTSAGGEIVFVSSAVAIHHDSARDIRSYCRRAQWGIEKMIPFCQRHPDFPENIERERVNGYHDWKAHSMIAGLRKFMKSALATLPVTGSLFVAAAALERTCPESTLLERVYRLLLGAHLFRGYRSGLKRFGPIVGADSAEPKSLSPAVH